MLPLPNQRGSYKPISQHAANIRPFVLVSASLLLNEPTSGQSSTILFQQASFVSDPPLLAYPRCVTVAIQRPIAGSDVRVWPIVTAMGSK